MRQFLKFVLASMLGTFLIGAVLIFLLIGMIAAAGAGFASKGQTTSIDKNTVLHLTLENEIIDRSSVEPFDLDLGPFKAQTPTGLNTILASLENAKTDDKIKGIFLDLEGIDAGFSTMREIRNKILEFRSESKKPVIAFSDTYSQGSYYLATAADEIYLQPKGDVDYRGLRSEYMFMKGMFDKLDIDIQFIRGSNNKFKSFGETFTEDKMSPENREQIRLILAGLWDDHLAAVAAKTGHDAARLNTIANDLLVRNANTALENGLVDGLKFRDEVLDILKERMDLDAEKDIQIADLRRYSRSFKTPGASSKKRGDGGDKEKVAVIYAEGSIMGGESEDGTIGSTSLSETIREARKDSTIKAIVLRVNSPGGSGLASDVIWREVDLARNTKPVVVSMGDVAASGGYYISAAASKIYASPTTITGSIGVFGMIPNMQGFFNNKLGITFDGEKTHHYADMMTVSRPLTAEEKGIIQGYVDDFYDGFKERVAAGRKLTVAQVDSIGQGRVWTGAEAKKLGLVDELGGLEDAIQAAADMAGLTDYRKVELPEQKDLLQQILEDLNAQARMWAASAWLGEDAALLRQYKRVREVREQTGIMARMPYDLVIH